MPEQTFGSLLASVRSCTLCAKELDHGVRPVLQIHQAARVLIAGQAPGSKVHATGVPFDDPSGERLRAWMGVDRETFYDASRIAILPMGFCYPGTGSSGDLPPRSECAQLWHDRLLSQLGRVRLTLVIGQYAQRHRLNDRRKSSLTRTVESWREFTPSELPLPHPSPRNNRWLKKNPWFDADVVPYLRRRVRGLLSSRRS